MVSNRKQTTLDSPVNQGVHADSAKPNKIGAFAHFDFEARNLTAYGGLLPVAMMLETLGEFRRFGKMNPRQSNWKTYTATTS